MRASRIIGALSLLLVAGCDDDTGPNVSGVPSLSIWEVRVAPSDLTILVTDTITVADLVQFSASALSRSGESLVINEFAWRSSDESIAVVDGNGVVLPIRPGTVEIHASAHKVGKARLVILSATETIVVTPLRDTIYVDEPIAPGRDTLRLRAEAFDPLGQLRPGTAFTWQSNSNTVLTVDQNGTVHANGLGTTSVTATSNSRFGGAQLHVLPVVANVSVTSPVAQVLLSDTVKLTAIARDYNNATMSRKFNWTSSNQSVATVDSIGTVVVVGVGQVTITGRTAHRSASVNITSFDRVLNTIEGGDDFTCGVANLGRGYCWGLSDEGQTGSPPDSLCIVGIDNLPCTLPPKQLVRSEVAYSSISAGGNFACGVALDRNLYCWGNNEAGQLGNGMRSSGASPSLATVKSERFTTVSAGDFHACALNLAGTAYCWGSDTDGQLGDRRDLNGASLASTTPIPVADTTLSFKAISAGAAHTCAITQAGVAYCWGDNDNGQLGNGLQSDSDIPVPVSGGLTYTAIAAGRDHSCGVTASGSMMCWGSNSVGQLGTGATGADVLVPTAAGGTGYTQVSAGDEHTCGLAGSDVRCWGTSESGQVGDGNPSNHIVASPTTVAGLQASSISLGSRHSCAMGTDGRARCWGSNRWGALGNEFQAAIRATPQLVARPR